MQLLVYSSLSQKDVNYFSVMKSFEKNGDKQLHGQRTGPLMARYVNQMTEYTQEHHRMTRTSNALSFCLLHESYMFPTDLVERSIRQWWKRNCSSKALLCIQDAKK